MHMMKAIWYTTAFFLLLTMFSCESGSYDLPDNTIGIDPTEDVDALNQSLLMKGHYYDTDMPEPTNLPGPVFSQTQSAIELSEGTDMFVPFTINDLGPAKVCAVYVKVLDALGHWEIPVQNEPQTNNFFFEVSIPRFVKTNQFKLVYTAKVCYDGGSFIMKHDTVETVVSPTVDCGDSLRGKGIGLTIKRYNLGDQKGKVNFTFYTGNIPDRIDIRVGQDFVYSTGTVLKRGRYPHCKSNGFVASGNLTRSGTFNYDPAVSKEVVLYVTGNCGNGNTQWNFNMECPEP